ncbi:pyridine nucleotide-disulfide oxidoreductase domain-containing protein 2 [Protobothrops mucrosquamatus]|uniref:pyridine nucleotide-disulfide oxidoreductase domain-containing protein 2 n=1 Tax=Protobothrops mucrosquamatus TaxID=103944 RepID=UPI000775AB73|nr:pyridine nucleotide-disulfide oxidoreductase domain-containing protein 2 [Protobothrops mucrosquamatus]
MASGHYRRLGPTGIRRILGGCRANHSRPAASLKREYDAVVIGAGHNGLVAAAYLQKGGLKTVVLERRYIVGGAAVTEEIIPGFHFSRASYLLSLLRPQIYTELELKKHGLKVLLRDPYSFTPILEDSQSGKVPRSLLLGNSMAETQSQISQFSLKDAQAFPKYEAFMNRLVTAIDPLLDICPMDVAALTQGSLRQRFRALAGLRALFCAGFALGKQLPQYYEVLTAPISKILDFWFESEPLKATLATDAVIGAMAGPHTPGSGYVLLHHVMGGVEGRKGAWGYVSGGMGALSGALARAATTFGAEIFTDKAVSHILLSSDKKVQGVCLQDGTEVKSRLVLSNASPRHTFLELTPQEHLPLEFVQRISQFDTRSPVTKINDWIILKTWDEESRPVIEMCIPSVLDPTLAPSGCHVISLFTQYTPYLLADEKQWDPRDREDYANRVFDSVEAYAPGFKASIIGIDVLTPPDLEQIFGLPGGNIFHGAMSLDQLYFARPVPAYSSYQSPIQGLYLCGSGAHPGGGVMGAVGRNAARVALEDFKNL